MTSENSMQEQMPEYSKFQELAMNNEKLFRRLGAVAFIGGIPAGAFASVFMDVNPVLAAQSVMSAGVLSYTMGVSGKEMNEKREVAGE